MRAAARVDHRAVLRVKSLGDVVAGDEGFSLAPFSGASAQEGVVGGVIVFAVRSRAVVGARRKHFEYVNADFRIVGLVSGDDAADVRDDFRVGFARVEQVVDADEHAERVGFFVPVKRRVGVSGVFFQDGAVVKRIFPRRGVFDERIGQAELERDGTAVFRRERRAGVGAEPLFSRVPGKLVGTRARRRLRDVFEKFSAVRRRERRNVHAAGGAARRAHRGKIRAVVDEVLEKLVAVARHGTGEIAAALRDRIAEKDDVPGRGDGGNGGEKRGERERRCAGENGAYFFLLRHDLFL